MKIDPGSMIFFSRYEEQGGSFFAEPDFFFVAYSFNCVSEDRFPVRKTKTFLSGLLFSEFALY